MRFALLPLVLFAFICAARAGDALAIGYNKDGIWTAVTYYSSSTPKGGADYKSEADARKLGYTSTLLYMQCNVRLLIHLNMPMLWSNLSARCCRSSI